MTFFEMIELKGRNGAREDWKFRIGVWLAKRVLTALANDPRLRKELAVILRVQKKYDDK